MWDAQLPFYEKTFHGRTAATKDVLVNEDENSSHTRTICGGDCTNRVGDRILERYCDVCAGCPKFMTPNTLLCCRSPADSANTTCFRHPTLLDFAVYCRIGEDGKVSTSSVKMGQIVEWFHEKGYGFIKPDQAGCDNVFVHVSQVTQKTHITRGSMVSYRSSFDKIKKSDTASCVDVIDAHENKGGRQSRTSINNDKRVCYRERDEHPKNFGAYGNTRHMPSQGLISVCRSMCICAASLGLIYAQHRNVL